MEILQIDKKWPPVIKRLGITESFALRLNDQISRLYVFNPPDSDILFAERKQLQYNLGILTSQRRLIQGPQVLANLPGLVWQINTDVNLVKGVFDTVKSHSDVNVALMAFITACRGKIHNFIQDQWIRSGNIDDAYYRTMVQNALSKIDYKEIDFFAEKLKKGERSSVLNIRDVTLQKIKAIQKMIE